MTMDFHTFAQLYGRLTNFFIWFLWTFAYIDISTRLSKSFFFSYLFEQQVNRFWAIHFEHHNKNATANDAQPIDVFNLTKLTLSYCSLTRD